VKLRNLGDVLLARDDTVRRAIEVIDKGAVQVGLVVDENRKLLGTVTDGDIRRGLLKGVTLDDSVSSVMNVDFIFVSEAVSRVEAVALMASESLLQLPVIDDGGRVIDLIFRNDDAECETFENWVVLMAGGEGRRLLPLTESLPKPMVHVGGKPMLETVLERCRDYGFRKFYISVNYRGQQIMEYFGDGSNWNVEIRYLNEDRPLGTAGSLAELPKQPLDPIVVVNGDVLSEVDLPSLLRFHNAHDAVATMGIRVHETQIPFGVVQIDGVRMESVIEKPVMTQFVNAGVYVLNPQLLETIPQGERLDMTQLLNSTSLNGSKVIVFPIHEHWLDVGTHISLEQANDDKL
jgi:dTDP-glucose pyrophosphorylase